MATEDRVKVLEGEFKLIKSELRQTLGSVRDFLLDLKLPPMQDEPGTIKNTASGIETPTESAPQSEGDNQEDGFGGPGLNEGFGASGSSPSQSQMPDFSNPGQSSAEQAQMPAEKTEEEPQSEALPPLDFGSEEDEGISSGDIPGQSKQKGEAADSEEGIEEGDQVETACEENLNDETAAQGKGGNYQAATPQVNMLANIIRWVSTAKKEIGSEQLPVFLDVYATTGSLSEEMKEIILHLAEVATNPSLSDETPENGQVISEQLKLCMEINRSSGQLPDEVRFKIQRLTELLLQQSISYNKADVWSKLLVDLHGILTGGGSTLRRPQAVDSSLLKAVQASGEVTLENNEEDVEIAVKPADDSPALDDEADISYEGPPKMHPNILKGTRPARLRLIMPMGEGDEQELDLGNLFIATGPKINTESNKKSNSSRK